jgi:HD-GYP domain-containing protein (c-di-GMP phosphodiesterase class II)
VAGHEQILKAEYIPLEQLPVPGTPDKTPGVLVVEEDISEVVHERERRIRLQRQLIETLITLVDKRDPNAANHSIRVSHIAYDVAHAMGLSPEMCETARTAGSLMNIGKIVVSSSVLTKRDSLSDDEKRAVKDSLSTSAELLGGIHFDGPVVETLQQAQENWDGTGPQGLKEEGILITARIIAVVNAFVSMISPRSYRAAMTVDAALRILLDKVDTIYDRKVVVAMANYIDNQGGRVVLEQMQINAKGEAA